MRDAAPQGLWLIVPVKPFGQGKSRLAAQLSPAERAEVSRRMLVHLLAEASASPELSGILVVSRDAQVLALAAQVGATPVLERGEGINAALAQAAQRAIDLGAQSALILPADLPLISREDMAALARHLPRPTGICLAASPDGGTNALGMRPVGAIPFAFGANSFERHRALAQAAGLACRTVTSPTLAVDLDQPGDLWAVGAAPVPVKIE